MSTDNLSVTTFAEYEGKNTAKSAKVEVDWKEEMGSTGVRLFYRHIEFAVTELGQLVGGGEQITAQILAKRMKEHPDTASMQDGYWLEFVNQHSELIVHLLTTPYPSLLTPYQFRDIISGSYEPKQAATTRG